jgi:hypothetical protein
LPLAAGSASLAASAEPAAALPNAVEAAAVPLDGKEPTDVKTGMSTDPVTTVRLSAAEAGRPVAALFNRERIVALMWPAAENRIAIAELTD